MSLMEVTQEMSAMFAVNQEAVDRVVRTQGAERSNAVLDAVDDFCDFVKSANREAANYAEKHKSGSGPEAYFQKRYRKKYTYDWQKDALNYHASVKSQVLKDREKNAK